MPLDDDDLFDSPQPKKPSNKIVFQPAGAQWSLNRLPEVESLYQSSFKKRLPLANRGQGSIHNKWGYDHRNSADVSINPSTPEGQQFVEQLKKANVPFLAFSSAIPGVATGPHIHIGFPSKRTQTKFNVGAQKKSKSIASDDLFDTDDDLFDSGQTPPPTSSAKQSATSTAAPSVPIEQALANVVRQANKIAPRVRRQARQHLQPTTAAPQLIDKSVPNMVGLLTSARNSPEAARREQLVEPEFQRLRHSQQKREMQYPGAERRNIAHTLKSDEQLREQASDTVTERLDMERQRPEIDEIKQKLVSMAGRNTHGARMIQSVQGALASSGIQLGNLLQVATTGERGGDLTDKMRLAQQALVELEHEDPNKGWIAAAERALPGAGFEAAKMTLLSGVPGIDRLALPGLGALSEADKGLGPTARAAAEGELLHQGFGRMAGMGRPSRFIAGTAVPAAASIAQGEDLKKALLTNTAFGAMAALPATQGRRANVRQVETQPNVTAQPEAVESAAPESTKRTIANQNALEPNQTAPQKFYHRDYGEVVESSNQRGIWKRRVRVTDAGGNEHIIKRTTMTGRGNERAVPLWPEPVPENLDTGLEPAPTPTEPAALSTATEVAPTASSPRSAQVEPAEGRPATSLKNTATDELRADLQLDDIAPPERKAWQTSIDNAQAKGLDKQADKITDKVIAGNREVALDLEESAALLIKTRELENQWEETYRANPADPKLADIKTQLDKYSTAADLGGTETARALNFRRAAIDKSFRLINLIRQAEKAKGREVTPEETQRYAQLVKERDTAIEQRDAVLEKVRTAELQRSIDREQRRGQRATTKADLDTEFNDLKGQLAQIKAMQTEGFFRSERGALDPEVAKIAVKMMRNRVRAGVTKAEQVIDDVHAALSEHLTASRREVAEALAGARARQRRQDEAVRQLAQVRGEIQSLLNAEDVATGRRSTKQEGPKRDLQRNQQRLKQLQQREAEYERKVNERDFTPKTKQPYPYSPEVRAAEQRVEIAEAKFFKEMKRAEGGHQLRNLSGLYKAWLLSGPTTHVKNIAGTMAYQVFNEGARLPAVIADAVLSRATGQRGISGPSPSAMLQSVSNAIRVGGREAGEIMRHGATKEQMERHQYQEIDFGVNTGKSAIDKGVKVIELAHNAIFRFMSASDRVSYQFALKRNLLDRAGIQARNEGLPASERRARARELVENPPEQLLADAKHDALVATFNNNNALSTKIKAARAATIKNPDLSRKAAERINAAENLALDLVLPFDRTPTNVVMRILEASPAGYMKNAAQLVKAAINKGMTVEDQRQFSQTFGKATAGTALVALGWKLADDLFDVDDKGIVSLKLGKHTIRLDYISPLGNLIATGVRLKKAHNERKGITEDAKIVGREVSNIPVLRATSGLSETMQDPARSGARTAARFAFGAVPFSGAVRFAGDALDPKERDAKGFKQQFQRNVPVWRQSLPEHVDKRRQRAELGDDVRMGRKSAAELSEMVSNGEITESRKQQILRDAKVSAKQARFNDYVPATALDRYERMDAAGREEVREQMEKKAYNLTHSDTLTDEQKAAFQERLDALGVVPQEPKKKSSGGFKDLFKQSAAPF